VRRSAPRIPSFCICVYSHFSPFYFYDSTILNLANF